MSQKIATSLVWQMNGSKIHQSFQKILTNYIETKKATSTNRCLFLNKQIGMIFECLIN